MALVRSLSRAAIGGTSVTLGSGAFVDPAGRAVKAAAMGVPRPELAVTLNGGGMVVAASPWP